MADRLIAACLLGLIALVPPAAAQLADPTRPLQGQTVPDTGAPDAQPAAAGLQSIILRKNAKPAALIDGAVVQLGGLVGEAKVVKITEDAVTLRGPQGEEEVLFLTPGIEKKVKVDAGKTAQKPAGSVVKRASSSAGGSQ